MQLRLKFFAHLPQKLGRFLKLNISNTEFYMSQYYIFIFFYSLNRTDVSLPQRVEYLARAVVCMRSDEAGYAPHLGVFLRELEDKVEVARIQQQVCLKLYFMIFLK